MSSKGKYPIGYGSNTVKRFQKRSVAKSAAFLSPLLHSTNTLLDCGCGPGSITLDFASILSDGHVVGIDIEPSQVEQAKELANERETTNATFQTADLLCLPFEDHTFDVAFAHAVLWTLDDPIAALNELARVVKPGGIIASRDPCADALTYYPTTPEMDRAFELQIQSHKELNSDNLIGKKMPSLFLQAGLKSIQATASCDLFSTKDTRSELADATIQAWEGAPWANIIRDKGWATEGEIRQFIQALREWERTPGALLSAMWCEVVGYVPDTSL